MEKIVLKDGLVVDEESIKVGDILVQEEVEDILLVEEEVDNLLEEVGVARHHQEENNLQSKQMGKVLQLDLHTRHKGHNKEDMEDIFLE